MYKFNQRTKSSGEIFDVVLSGGSPWGFTLQGGSEFRTKLCVLKVTPGGKADLSLAIAVGDEIIAINGIECASRAEAIELVRCSRQKLRIALRRVGGGPSPVAQSNGGVIKKSGDVVPNLYKTANDFYSTFNVDRQKFAEITQNKKSSNIFDSTDNLSASHENLLESYRQVGNQRNFVNSPTMEETGDRLSRSSTEIANGRTSPEVDGLSGVSLPEGQWPVMHHHHQRMHTSPGRIQKVTVKSTNIKSPVSPRGSPPDKDTENQHPTRKNPNDWVGRWLMDQPGPLHHQLSVTNSGSATLDYRDTPDRRISLHERTSANKSQSLPRSKSFGGPTSYGVTVTATAVKRNEFGLPANNQRTAQRYSSSNLLQERQQRVGLVSDIHPNEISARQADMSWISSVYAQPGDSVELRLPREMMGPKMTTSESTSSLDSIGTMDSSVSGARRQGPAPPPRRSVSKLLSSFRTSGRRRVPDEVQIPPRFGAVSRISRIASDQPKHSVSRSWPTDHVDGKSTGNEASRQSWHAEPAVASHQDRREANSSISSSSGDATPERKISKTSSMRYSSSVVIKTMRSSSSSSMDEKSTAPTVYRSGQIGLEAEKTPSDDRAQTLPARQQFSDVNPPAKITDDFSRWPPSNERETAGKNRYEDTPILQRLMKDNAKSLDTSPSVKSRIANFEGGLKKSAPGPPPQERPRLQPRSFSQGKLDLSQQPLKESIANQSSSMDSLLDTRSPGKHDSASKSQDQDKSPIQGDQDRAKQWEASRRRSDEEFRRPSRSTSNAQNSLGSREPRLYIETSPLRQERQQALEKPLKQVEISTRNENRVNLATERVIPQNEKPSLNSNIPDVDFSRKSAEEEPPHPSNEDENDVFWDADDSLPPPPPLELLDPLEMSQDNLPLPSPPREVLVEFPSSTEDYESRRDRLEQETLEQNGVNSSDVIKPVGSFAVESSVETNHKTQVELNGPGKLETSGLSSTALDFSGSTDLSSNDTSLTEEKKYISPRAPPPAPLVITSTPSELEGSNERGTCLDVPNSPRSASSNTSTPSGSRPNSMLSPKLVELDKEKADLVESMKQKIVDLRSQMDEIKDEIDGNEELGQRVTKVVEGKTSATQFSKYQLFTGELNKIIGLLLILTQRMHRYEMMLHDLDMSEEADRQQRDVLLDKIDKVTLQHEEACKIKEVNDKRGEVVSRILENCLEEEEYADFQYYIDMKTQLALMHAEIRDKVKMGEERLSTLNSTKIDWSILSLT